jgi:large subunit ribosomal protein L24
MVSKQPRKQRLARYSAPQHQRRKFLSAPLNEELRKKHMTGAVPVRKGDRVKIMRGDFKKMDGEITEVDTKRGMIFVQGATITKADGTQVQRPIRPSGVMILSLVEDKERSKAMQRRLKVVQ